MNQPDDLSAEADKVIDAARAQPARVDPPAGVSVSVGELFPWKNAWWRVTNVIELKDTRTGATQQGLVIVPEKNTMGGVKRAQRGKGGR